MYKQLSIFMLLFVTFILVACGDKGLSREEVIEKSRKVTKRLKVTTLFLPSILK